MVGATSSLVAQAIPILLLRNRSIRGSFVASNTTEQLEILTRNAAEVVPVEELKEKLDASGVRCA